MIEGLTFKQNLKPDLKHEPIDTAILYTLVNCYYEKTSGTSQYVSKYRQRIRDAVDDIEDNRILEEEDAMAREAGEINDGDLVENKDVDDKTEGNNYTFQILVNMRAFGEA